MDNWMDRWIDGLMNEWIDGWSLFRAALCLIFCSSNYVFKGLRRRHFYDIQLVRVSIAHDIISNSSSSIRCSAMRYGRLGGWMDGWMVGWVDKWMDGWIDGWMDGWMD